MTSYVSTAEGTTPRAISGIGLALVLTSVLGSTLGIVIAQFLDDFGDGLLAEILGGDAILYNNRVEFTGASEVAWAGGFLLCLILGFLALLALPARSRRQVPQRLLFLWMMLHVLRQALGQAVALPWNPESQLGRAYATLDPPAGLDMVIAAAAGVGLLLIALAAAAAFLALTPHRTLIPNGRKRLTFVLWMALIPAAASAFLAIPYFLPVGQIIRSLPLTAVMFLATLVAARGTTTVRGPEDWRKTAPWPWDLAVTLIVLLVFYLVVLQGGVSLDPRQWG